jgi:uncharacterized cupin superfamily protein
VNLHDDAWERDHDREGYRWRAKRIGGELLGAGLYDLPPGERTWPYHYHHGCEEWLLVVDGEPTLRTPEGERALAPGDIVCFPAGPDGAHQLIGPGRVLIASDLGVPRTSHYPDSDKVSARMSADEALIFRRDDAVDYWEGE